MRVDVNFFVPFSPPAAVNVVREQADADELTRAGRLDQRIIKSRRAQLAAPFGFEIPPVIRDLPFEIPV